jgi:hypothetical protein
MKEKKKTNTGTSNQDKGINPDFLFLNNLHKNIQISMCLSIFSFLRTVYRQSNDHKNCFLFEQFCFLSRERRFHLSSVSPVHENNDVRGCVFC